MGNFGAIAPGTDLSKHARDLLRVHEAVIAGGQPPMSPRPLVARSWARVMDMGLEPDRNGARDPVSWAELERRRRDSPLSLVIDDIRSVVCSVADASRFLMVVTDADGVILWRQGAAAVRRRADRLGFTEGAVWTEQTVGTNAIGTALQEEAPVQLFSAEHFAAPQHPWYCTASPLHDPRTGELLGVVDVSGPALTLHPAIEALVETAVRLGESLLWRYHQVRLTRLRNSAEHVLSTLREPALLVDEHGWVAYHTGVSYRERVEAPRANRTIAVTGLGLCIPERLGDGWLVRAKSTTETLEAQLDLTSSPVLELRSRTGSWRTGLTPRHAQILVLLHRAGREGVTATALSTALFGDPDHTVTARAEVSRLRRVIGALVTPNPYRLAGEVTLTVLQRPQMAEMRVQRPVC